MPATKGHKRRPTADEGDTTSSKRARSSSPSGPLISLEAFISNIFYDVFIQDQEDIFEITLNRNWSRAVEETYGALFLPLKLSKRFSYLTSTRNNGEPLNFCMFRDFVVTQRRAITNRQLLSQSFVVAPADPEGRTGAVAHTSLFSGVQHGKEVKGTIVSVLKVGWDEKRERRTVETENFVFAFVD